MGLSILKSKNIFLTLVFIVGCIFTSIAQPGGPGGAPGGGDVVVGGALGGGGATGVPLDGGTFALFIIGMLIVLEHKFNFIYKFSKNKISG